VSELQGLVNTTVKGGLEARVLVIDEMVNEKVPPVLEVAILVAGVTDKLGFAVAVMVPAPVTVMLTVAVLPPFFLTDTVPMLELIEPPAHVALGGVIKLPPPPEMLHGLSSKWVKVPFTTAEVATSADVLTLATGVVAGVGTPVSIVTSPEPAT